MLYFEDGALVAESGLARVYKYENNFYLEIGAGHTLWAVSDEIKEYEAQLGGKPHGVCLEIGLGLGVASSVITSHTEVDILITVEANDDVIAAYNIMHPIEDLSNKHIIVSAEGLSFLKAAAKKGMRYDFIFMDFYSLIDEDTLPQISSMYEAANKVLDNKGEIIGWFDPETPEEFVEEFKNIFRDDE